MPVADLAERLSWDELTHWVAYYAREADLAIPKDKRPARPQTPEEAAQALDRAFGLRSPKKKTKGKA